MEVVYREERYRQCQLEDGCEGCSETDEQGYEIKIGRR